MLEVQSHHCLTTIHLSEAHVMNYGTNQIPVMMQVVTGKLKWHSKIAIAQILVIDFVDE